MLLEESTFSTEPAYRSIRASSTSITPPEVAATTPDVSMARDAAVSDPPALTLMAPSPPGFPPTVMLLLLIQDASTLTVAADPEPTTTPWAIVVVSACEIVTTAPSAKSRVAACPLPKTDAFE